MASPATLAVSVAPAGGELRETDIGGSPMLDLSAYRAHAWRSWQVFGYAFVVYLLAIVGIVHHGSLAALGPNELFAAALFGAVATAGVGYQEVRDLGGFQRTPHWTADRDR